MIIAHFGDGDHPDRSIVITQLSDRDRSETRTAGFAKLLEDDPAGGRPSMEDLARRTQDWKDSHPLKEWRRRKGYSTQQAALVLDVKEARVLHLEAGESPTDDEMKSITQRTGITRDHWITWDRALPRG